MILNKYNEIMEKITVDPEMKSRIMAAVSASIKEQAEGKAVVSDISEKRSSSGHKNGSVSGRKEQSGHETGSEHTGRRKARRSPLAIIGPIAAAVIVIIGVVFVMKYMGMSKGAVMETNGNSFKDNNHAAAAQEAAETVALDDEMDWNSGDDAYSTDDKTVDSVSGDTISGDTSYNFKPNTTDLDKTDRNLGINSTSGIEEAEEGMGDVRRERIGKALPFDLKAIGTGNFSSDITTEMFLGNEGQKAVLLTGPEGTDIVKAFYPSNKSLGELAVTPGGTAAKLYRIPFGNVLELGKDETSTDVNAALYSRDGKTYMLIFSEIQSPEVILGVIDAV